MSELFEKMIEEICEEEKIGCKNVSYGWLKELSKDGKHHYLRGYNFDINSFVAKTIASDKYATYAVLKDKNVDVVEHNMIFNPETRDMYFDEALIEKTMNMIDQYGKVIVKANCSYCGKDVYLCENKEEVEKTIYQLFSEGHDTLSSQPFYDVVYEYRCIFLNGEIKYIYKKERPYEIENGVKVYSSWKHNLSLGGIPITIDENEKNYNQIIDLAVRAANAINIKFASVDIVLTRDEKLYVMEINSNVCFGKFSTIIPGGYDIAKNIYRKAIKYMFED